MSDAKKRWNEDAIPPVSKPSKRDIPKDVDDTQDGHEEGSLVVADPDVQCIWHQVDEADQVGCKRIRYFGYCIGKVDRSKSTP